MYATGGYDGSAFKSIQACSKRLRDKSPEFTGFLEAKTAAGDLHKDEDTMFSTPHHCSPNRYLTSSSWVRIWRRATRSGARHGSTSSTSSTSHATRTRPASLAATTARTAGRTTTCAGCTRSPPCCPSSRTCSG